MEVVMAVSIVVLLAAFLVPAVNAALQRRQNTLCASHWRIAINAFELCKSEMGEYPLDVSRKQIPPEMTDYFNDLGITDWWADTTEVGGNWDWDKNNNFSYSVSIADPTASLKQMARLDALLDDGVLTTGNLRKIASRYHYILEE